MGSKNGWFQVGLVAVLVGAGAWFEFHAKNGLTPSLLILLALTGVLIKTEFDFHEQVDEEEKDTAHCMAVLRAQETMAHQLSSVEATLHEQAQALATIQQSQSFIITAAGLDRARASGAV